VSIHARTNSASGFPQKGTIGHNDSIHYAGESGRMYQGWGKIFFGFERTAINGAIFETSWVGVGRMTRLGIDAIRRSELVPESAGFCGVDQFLGRRGILAFGREFQVFFKKR
jgi:hypothetical protein